MNMYEKLAFQINSCQSEKPDILMGEEHLAKLWKLASVKETWRVFALQRKIKDILFSGVCGFNAD